MPDASIQTLAIGVMAALLAFELLVAITSWFEAREIARPERLTSLSFTRPFAIRNHMQVRQSQINELRRQYPRLRSAGHAHEVRRAMRRLQPSRIKALLTGCSTCRGSRMRGLSHCPSCGLRLVARDHGSAA